MSCSYIGLLQQTTVLITVWVVSQSQSPEMRRAPLLLNTWHITTPWLSALPIQLPVCIIAGVRRRGSFADLSRLQAAALLARAGPVSRHRVVRYCQRFWVGKQMTHSYKHQPLTCRKMREPNFERTHPDKTASVRSINGHSKGFWRHGRR